MIADGTKSLVKMTKTHRIDVPLMDQGFFTLVALPPFCYELVYMI